MNSTCISCMILTMALFSTFSSISWQKWKRRRADSGLFRIQPRNQPPAGGFSKLIFVADKLIFKISNRWKNNTHFYYFSTFSSISWPKIETKTCRFGTISDSATRSISCRRFFEIHFRCGESLTLLPFKPLILTPPAKIVDNCLPLGFHPQFFLRMRS